MIYHSHQQNHKSADREQLVALLAEAQRADPGRGNLATQIIFRADIPEVRAAGRADLLEVIDADLTPMTCRGCGGRLQQAGHVHGWSVSTAAITQPRYGLVLAFCEPCVSQGRGAVQEAVRKALGADAFEVVS
jgi:hypothetical protein